MVKPVGILVNPASGKDVRRLVARASVFDNREKAAIVRRALTGAVEAGAREFCYFADSHQIAASALQEIDSQHPISSQAVAKAENGRAEDTTAAAQAMRQADCGPVLVLGGDGTSRAFVKGWRDAMILPLSTGTNNVFPAFAEATIAGAVVGLVAAGGMDAEAVARQTKIIEISIEGEDPDIALIDAVVTTQQFIGSKALLDPEALRLVVLSRADPAAPGMTSIGGLVSPITDTDDVGLSIKLGEGAHRVRAPIAPGLFHTLRYDHVRQLALGEVVSVEGPCILACDGERERVIKAHQIVQMRVMRRGPYLIDVGCVMNIAAEKKYFIRAG
ncbi:MAG: NAD(+)/NADH kinase [Gammaproteobacteria bacterium]|nr:NAD(+)/NADH kinase [Gammaproteobacteria bacterium]